MTYIENIESLRVSATDIDGSDKRTGFIYVLRSLSDNSDIRSFSNLYKIGFSTTSVERRIACAENSATYLYAPVEIVAVYSVFNLKASVFEHLIHRIFGEVNLDIYLTDSEGKIYKPSEWFIAPFEVIDDAIEKLISGDILDFTYDKNQQKLIWTER